MPQKVEFPLSRRWSIWDGTCIAFIS